MKLDVGEFYLSAGGEIIEINFFNKYSMFEDINCNSYFESGECDGDCREFDLIAHIPKELHFDIIKTIKAYFTDNTTKEHIDFAYKNKL